jgi:hypothetical protein
LDAGDGIGVGGGLAKQVFEELSDGAAAAWIDERGRDFRERNKDEGALGEAGMGQLEAGFADAEVAEEKQIEIEGARAVGEAAHAVAAVLPFDGKKALQEDARCE